MAKKKLAKWEKREAELRAEKKLLELGFRPVLRPNKGEKLLQYFTADLVEILENRPEARLVRGDILKAFKTRRGYEIFGVQFVKAKR